MLSDIRSLSTLIFPLACIGCGALEYEICPTCWKLWRSQPVLAQIDQLTFAFTARYQPTVQRFILAAKENGSKSARNALAEAIGNSLTALITQQELEKVLLVPIPSSKSAIRSRGRDHSLLLAQAVARSMGRQIDVLSILRVNRRVADQTGLNHRERAANLSGAFTADSQLLRGNFDPSLVIVDDVVTSGSSVREAARALTKAGLPPTAAVSACASARFLPIRLPLAKPGPARAGSELMKEDLWSRY